MSEVLEAGTIVTPAEIFVTPFFTPEVTATRPPENTKAPSQNPNLTKEPSLTPVSGLEAGLIPIGGTHFTSEVFREYIYENYDKNRDRMLSAEEREAVKEIEKSEKVENIGGNAPDLKRLVVKNWPQLCLIRLG